LDAPLPWMPGAVAPFGPPLHATSAQSFLGYVLSTKLSFCILFSSAGLHNSKLEGPNHQHIFAAGCKYLFHFDVEISLYSSMEEIIERQLLARGWAFTTFLTTEKALAARGPCVVQVCSSASRAPSVTGRNMMNRRQLWWCKHHYHTRIAN